MTNKIYDAFEPVRADAALKASTRAYLHARQERERPRRQVWKGALAAVCAALALTVGLGSYRLFTVPVAYISVDVNPSVELALNAMDRVISAQAYNEDGERVLKGLTLEGKTYGEAIDVLLSGDAMTSYLTADSALTFTVAADSHSREAALLAGVTAVTESGVYGGQCHSAGMDTLTAAHDHGLSFGKYAAYQVLAQYDETVTVEDCRGMTMGELHHRIQQEEEAHHGNGGSGDQSGGEEEPSGVSTAPPFHHHGYHHGHE